MCEKSCVELLVQAVCIHDAAEQRKDNVLWNEKIEDNLIKLMSTEGARRPINVDRSKSSEITL